MRGGGDGQRHTESAQFEAPRFWKRCDLLQAEEDPCERPPVPGSLLHCAGSIPPALQLPPVYAPHYPGGGCTLRDMRCLWGVYTPQPSYLGGAVTARAALWGRFSKRSSQSQVMNELLEPPPSPQTHTWIPAEHPALPGALHRALLSALHQRT